ncbi:MAG: serine/threonine-protein kinase, partial [Proteobacteria bacterium]|nr:serine/threonine-protein kinase [Pseudomonadota bacterium]
MAPPPPDRTETLSPRPDHEVGGAAAIPITVPPVGADDPDRYEAIGEHGRGGLGRVVRAVDRRLHRTVAVKELLRRNDAGNEARFMREALITARLEHPGIVPVHEAGRWPNGEPYYVMKLVEGRTLKELIAEQPALRERLVLLQHVIAIADAVGYAHSEGVIHRDLKPSNVIVGEFGETIVVDWGLARDLRQEREPNGDQVIGTPAYMAPEQARGELVDERADVYAIGAILYEVLAGAAPHAATGDGDEGTPRATLARVLAGPPRPIGDVVPAIPRELATIVGKAMARVPESRYRNATALAEDLRRYQTGKLVSAHSYTPLSRLRKKLGQHRGVAIVAAASALALAGVGVASFRGVVAERNIANTERLRTEAALASTEQRKRELVLLQAETALREDPTATLAWLKASLATSPVASTPGARSPDDLARAVDLVDEATSLGVAKHVFRAGDWVFDAVFTPDGKTLIAAVRDGTLRAYDLATGSARTLGRASGASEMLALAPDGVTVITGGSMGEVRAWPLAG